MMRSLNLGLAIFLGEVRGRIYREDRSHAGRGISESFEKLEAQSR